MNSQASHVPTPSGRRPAAIRQLLSAFVARSQSAALVSALLALAALPVQAATRYWDGGTVDITTNGDGNSDGVGGTWNTTLKNWDQGSGLAHVAWVNGSNEAEINGGTQTLTLGANIILGGIVQKAGGTATINGGSGPYTLTLNITGSNTFLAAANSTTGRPLTVNAVIAGAAGKNLVLAGPATSDTGTINLGGANTYGGTTSFSAGATGGACVHLRNRLAFQNSTVTLSPDADLIFDSSVSANAFTFGGLAAGSAGTGCNLDLRNSASTPIALTVGGNNSNTTYKGVLSGSGSLIKTGRGTLTLAAANTYTGSTTVSAGTLQVDGGTISPITVNNGATLAGNGTVNAAVTVDAGGSITAGNSNLTVSSLTFSGAGSINAGSLSGYTGVAAIKVTNALTVSGGAGTLTINLPTGLGFNGRYHLIQFGSWIANAKGFTLGTVPALAWNQTGALQVKGNYLDYVITAAGDTTPPSLGDTLPANNDTTVLANADLVATFDETVVPGSGSIELRRSSDGGLVESFNVTSSSRLVFSTARLIIQPTNDLPTGKSYYILIPAGSVKDTSGNSYAGITGNTGWKFTVPVPTVLYTDTGSPANPPWSAILPTLNVQSADPGPVYGSLVKVNNAAVETGLYGNRPISIPDQRIHVACNTATNDFASFTRWFQTDGNTHVLRVFVDDENTATTRPGTSSHTEAFMGGGWNYTDNMTYEWTAHYTIARSAQGYSCFQLKNTDNDWAVSLGMNSDGTLTVNNRTSADKLVTNPDGSARNFNGGGFDVRVLDDGLNYKLWVDGVLYASGSYSRPTGTTTFRWGMYFGANNLKPPADYNLILVSGAQVKSWPGTLATATTTITKANNSTYLNNGGSWVGNLAPGLYNQALWNSTVTSTNSTTLATDQLWAGLKIANPGGTVTINGSALLGLDDSGLDMATATRNLYVNCPVQMTVPSTWSVATGRKATFNGVISGYQGLTVSGGGTVQLEAANTYRGDTTLSGGTLVANDDSALGNGRLVFDGGTLSNTASCTLGNDVSLNSNAVINVVAPQTLTLQGAISGTGSLTKSGTGTLTFSGENAYTGTTIVSGGTLAIGKTSALLSTNSLTLAGGTLLRPDLDGVVISAPITVAGSGNTATISAPTNAPGGGVISTLTLDSVLAGSGNVTFSSSVDQNALSTIYLGAQSTYAGGTLVDTAGTPSTQIIVRLGTNNAMPVNTVLTIDGQAGSGSGRFAELNLNGFNQQLAGLTNNARSLRIQRVVNSDISAAATLTINNSSDHVFSGNLGGGANGSVAASAMPGSTNGNNFGLTKSGAGTFTLAGANTYTGGTTISGGILNAAISDDALGSNRVTFNGGVRLVVDTGLDIPNAITLGPNAGERGRGLIEAGTTAGTSTVSGAITINIGATAGGHFAAPTANTILHVAGPITSSVTVQSRIGTVMFSGGGTGYSGFVAQQGTAIVGANNGISTAAYVTLGYSAESTLDLNGFNQSLAGIVNGAYAAIVGNSSTTSDSTLTTTGTATFAGTIRNAIGAGTKKINLTVNGGVLTLTGVNTYTGTTTLNAGMLQGVAGGACANSSVILNNASAALGVSITNNTQTWTCAALTTSAAGTLEFDFGSVPPGSVSPLTVTGPAGFATSPKVRVIVGSGLAPGTYPLMTWGSVSGTAPTVVSMLKPDGTSALAGGTKASLGITGNTLNLVIAYLPVFTKANNTKNLNLGSSWVTGMAPVPTVSAGWNSTVSSANTTVLGADVTWGGITIENPGGPVTINAGNTLTIGARDIDIDMSSATADLTLNCPLVVGDANVWNVANGRLLTLGGVVSGSFPVTKLGAGTALLSGANTYSGDTTISNNSGTLEIGGAGQLGGGAYAGAITIGSGSVFKFSSSAAQTLGGTISGSGTLHKTTGANTLTLGNSNNSFTGVVTVNAGMLVLGHPDALGSASAITLAGGTALTPTVQNVAISAPITLISNPTINAPDFGSAGTVSTLTLGGAISGSASLTLGSTSTVASNSRQTILLNAQSGYTGGTTLHPAGSNANLSVCLGIDNALPPATVLSINGVASGGSSLFTLIDLNGYNQMIGGLQNTTAFQRSQQILNSSTTASTLTINNAADHTFSGNINGTRLSLVKTGPGTLTLTGTNTYAGSTRITGGILSLGNSQAMQDSTLDTHGGIAGDATNGLRTTVTSLILGGLSGDKNLASVFTTSSGGYSGVTALTLNPDAGATPLYSGVIADGASGMSLIKTGNGTQILSGANTYTGPTIINAGTLSLGAGKVLANTSNVIIGNATLDASTFTNTAGTLAVTGSATIQLGVGARLAFAKSSAVSWAGGALHLSGPIVFGPAGSLRFGTGRYSLTVTQLLQITADGYGPFALDANGYLVEASFSNWLAAYAPATGFTTDSDKDGIPNGLEMILGTNPNVHSPGLTVASSKAGSVTFRHRLNPCIPKDVTYGYEWSTDLAEWTTSGQTNTGGTTATIVASKPDGQNMVTVVITITGGPSSAVFGRLTTAWLTP